MKKPVVLSLLLLMCIGIGAQRVQKMSHDIRRLVNQTNSQVRRAPGAKQHEMVRVENHMGGKVLMDVTPPSKQSTPAGGARVDSIL